MCGIKLKAIVICIFVILIHQYVSFSFRSPDWIELPPGSSSPIQSVLLKDQNTLLVFGGKSHFTLQSNSDTGNSPLNAPTFLNNNLSSVVKRVSNGQIVMVCGSNHISMFNEDNTNTINYDGMSAFSTDVLCSFVEIDKNMFLLAYSKEMKYIIELIQFDEESQKFVNKALNQFSGSPTMIMCDIFKDSQQIFCAFNINNVLKGRLFNINLKTIGNEITSLMPYYTYYQIFRTDNKTLLLFGSLNSILGGQKLTMDNSLAISSAKKLLSFNAGLKYFLNQICLCDLGNQTILVFVTLTDSYFTFKISYEMEFLGIEMQYTVPANLVNFSVGLFNRVSMVVLASCVNQKNYMYFMVDPKCVNKEYHLNVGQSQYLNELVDELSPKFKHYMAVTKKIPATIAENPTVALNNQKDIEVFTFKLTSLGFYEYHFFITEGLQLMIYSPLCSLKLIVCFDSCKECSNNTLGTQIENQCTQCNDGYYFDVTSPGNCGLGCDPSINYHYYDENGSPQCVVGLTCPIDYRFLIENSIQCTSSCLKHNLIGDIKNNECVSACPTGTFFNQRDNTCDEKIQCLPGEFVSLTQNGCVTEDEIQKEMDDIMNDLEDNIIHISNNFDNFSIGNSTIEICNTSIKAECNIFQNTSKINLGECEDVLRKTYNIPSNESLIIFKKDIIVEGYPTNRVEFSIFTQDGIKLNLSICDETPILVTIPVNNASDSYNKSKDFNSIGVNIYDNEDAFFNDICFPYAEKKVDMPRVDRGNEIYQDNSTMCPGGCELKNINYSGDNVECKCTEITDLNQENPFDSLKSSIMNSLFETNWEVFFCYNLVFTINIFPFNIGNWFMLSIALLLIIDMIYFAIRSTKPIRSYLLKLHNKSIRNSIKFNYSKTNGVPFNTVEIENTLSPTKIRRRSTKFATNQNTETPTAPKGLPKYTLEEYNDMNFDELFLNDHRNLMQHYLAYIQQLQPLVNTFFTPSQKVLRSIKICLFLMSLAIDFTLSAFFYSDKYLSKNYRNGGNPNFWYNLPISVYTYLLGIGLNIILNLLSDSEKRIEKIEKQKNPNAMMHTIKGFTKCYQIKMIFFFTFQILLVSLFWYYTTAFCGANPNSQDEWFENGLISTAMSQTFPFAFALVFSIIIQCGLKYRSVCCYKIVNMLLKFM